MRDTPAHVRGRDTEHLVPIDVRERFSDWPEVTLICHDRRETLALDIEATGWANTMR